jgi:hypothetical protein
MAQGVSLFLAFIELFAKARSVTFRRGFGLARRFQQLDGAQNFFFQGLEIGFGGNNGFNCVCRHDEESTSENIYLVSAVYRRSFVHDCG